MSKKVRKTCKKLVKSPTHIKPARLYTILSGLSSAQQWDVQGLMMMYVRVLCILTAFSIQYLHRIEKIQLVTSTFVLSV